MSRSGKDNIEDFFRKGLSQEQSPFMEEDWKKMEKLLNAHEAGRAAAAFPVAAKVGGAAAIALLLILSGYLFFRNTRIDKTSVAPDGSRKVLSTETQAASVGKALESNTGADLISKADKSSQQTVSSVETTPVSPGHDSRVPASSSYSVKDHWSKNHSSLKPNSIVEVQSSGSEILSVNLPAESADQSLADEKVIEDKAATESKKDSVVTTFAEAKEEQPSRTKEKVASRWSVAAVYAPDYSATEMGNFSSPGRSFGLVVSFDLFKRLSISPGLLRSAKLYTGYGKDYSPPEGYWQRRTNGVVPDEIIGNCDVWEIPLIFRYAVIDRPKSRVYIAGGMTTYLITSEKYIYCFNNPNPGAASGWSTEKSTTYPFNVGYFAAGFEQRVSKHISLGVEPFMKIPFKGMGWSNVSIYSAGAYFSMRYRFLKNVQPTD